MFEIIAEYNLIDKIIAVLDHLHMPSLSLHTIHVGVSLSCVCVYIPYQLQYVEFQILV